MYLTRRFSLFTFIFLLCFWAKAQKFTATTTAKDVVERQEFEVEFKIENNRIVDFSPPDFSPAIISGGPYTGQRSTNINGVKTTSQTYTYVLFYPEPGKYTIPPGKIVIGNNVVKSTPININVFKAENKSVSKDEILYMKSELSDSSVYVGQQIFIDQYVFFGNMRIFSPTLQKGFAVDQFILHDIKSVQQSTATQKMIDGKMLNTALIGRLSATPLRSGDMNIPEMFFNINVEDDSGPRRSRFRKNYTKRIIKLDPFPIKIKPLPEGAPPSFTGAVGRLNVTSTLSKGTPQVGKEILVTLEMMGNGLIDQVTAPKWVQEGFEIYDPKLLNEEQGEQNGELVFRKFYQYIVVPLEGGKKRLEVPYAYFDTDKEEYVEKVSKSTLLNIKGDASILADATTKDIQNIDSVGGNKWYEQLWFWGIIVALAAALIFYLNNRKPKEEVVEITEEEAALLVAKRQLAGAKSILDSGNTGKYWETLESSLRIYLEEKIGIGTTQYSMERVESFWAEKKYPSEQLQGYKSMIEKINLARYAGQSIDDMQDLYKVAEQWIVQAEKL